MKNSVNFEKAYKKLFREYSNMIDIGAYKNIGAEDIVQEGVIKFLEYNKSLDRFESQDHLVRSMAMFIKNRRRSLTHNKHTRVAKMASYEDFTYHMNDDYTDEATFFDPIDVSATVYTKHYLTGLTYEEVGKMMGTSHTHVIRQVRKEIKHLV